MSRYVTADGGKPDRPAERSRRPSMSDKFKAFFSGGLGSKSRGNNSAKLTKTQDKSRDASRVRYASESIARTFPTDNSRRQHRHEVQEQQMPISRPRTGNIPPSNHGRGRGSLLDTDPYASNANNIRSLSLPPKPPPKDNRPPISNFAAPKPDILQNPHAKRLRAQREEIRERRTESFPQSPDPDLKVSKEKELPDPKITHKRTGSSGSAKWGEYLMDSADRLDASIVGLSSSLAAKSKKLTAKFRLPVDSGDGDSDSGESFYCIGESLPAKYESTRRRPGREGAPSFTASVNPTCKRCGIYPLDNQRIICRNCEKQYPSRDFEDANVIKPTPPLKKIPRKPIPTSYKNENIPRLRIGTASEKPVLVSQTTKHVAQQAVWSTGSQSSRGRAAEVGPEYRGQMSARYTPNDPDSMYPTAEEADAISRSRHPLRNQESQLLMPEQAAHALRFEFRSPSPVVRPRADRIYEQQREPVSPASDFGSSPAQQSWGRSARRANFVDGPDASSYRLDLQDVYDDRGVSPVSPVSAESPSFQSGFNAGSWRGYEQRPPVSKDNQSRDWR